MIFVALVLLLQAAPLLAAGVRVKDSTKTLSVVVPSTWVQSHKEATGVKLALLGPMSDDFVTNIVLITEKVGRTSLADYCKITEQNGPKMINAYKSVSSTPTKLGGVAAMECVYTGIVKAHDTKLKFKSVVAIKNGTAYTFTFTSLVQYFKDDVGALDTMLKSAKWLK